MILKKSLALALAAVCVTSSGCLLRRDLVHVKDHPSKKVTQLATTDVYLHKLAAQQWECADEADKLVCSPSCAGGAELECHTITLGMSNLQ